MPPGHDGDFPLSNEHPEDPHGPLDPTASSSSTAPPLTALFPPVFFSDPDAPPDLAAVIAPAKPVTRQRCISWCSQSEEGVDPICRMACLRTQNRKPAVPWAPYATAPPPNPPPALEYRSPSELLSAFRSATKALISDRELLFFRGTLDEMKDAQMGVVTQTKEAKAKMVKGKDGKMVKRRRAYDDDREYRVEWSRIGDTGHLARIPLGSILVQPATDWLARVKPIFAPSTRLLTAYFSSFTDGTQLRTLPLIYDRATSGEVFTFADKLGRRMWEHWGQRLGQVREARERREREWERDERRREAEDDRGDGDRSGGHSAHR